MSPADRPTERVYTRIPGEFRGFLRRHSLWLGDDHLLLVDSTRFSETYKRFYLRDIQTIIVRKTPRFRLPYYWVLLTIAALVALLAGLNPFRQLLFWPAMSMLAGIVVYLYFASMFQSCSCHLITRVTKAELPSLFRLRAAREFVDMMTPRITPVQGVLPADWLERSASLEETATAADRNPDEPVDLLPAAQFSWVTVGVFLLVMLDAVLTVLQLRANDSSFLSTANTVNLIALAVCATYAIVRLTRQRASRALRALVVGGLLVVAAVMYGSIIVQSFDQQFFHQTYRNTLLYPGMRQLALFEIFADAAIALPGIVLAFRGKGGDGMTSLARQQCFNHPGREAIVRCPSCKRDFCRECVTEHEDRYLCSACLLRDSARAAQTKRTIRVPVGAIVAVLGLLTAWTVYYAATEYLVLRSGSAHNYRTWHAR